jgi:Cof subfamily protein (haloacid dehalogenase superfamily)
LAAHRRIRGQVIVSGARDIRLLLSDVDGTLVTNDKILTDGAIAAARALQAAGIALALTSSRPARGMGMLVQPLELQLPLAGCNGGTLVNPDMSVIESHPIGRQAARTIVDFLAAKAMDIWIYTETDWLVPAANAPHVAREASILKFDATVVSTFTDEHLDHAVKIVGVSDDLSLMAASEAAAQTLLGDRASATRSAAHFLDVTNPFANKGQVVHTLAKWLGIDPTQIAAIGDMPNDVLMFRQSGFSIAMGNASDAVKAQASAITDSNENNGFAKAVRRFLMRLEAP